eukprot:10648046-Ditylum_brightwellii.AAC.1
MRRGGTGDCRLIVLEASHLHRNLVMELKYVMALTQECRNANWVCSFPSALQSLCAVQLSHRVARDIPSPVAQSVKCPPLQWLEGRMWMI